MAGKNLGENPDTGANAGDEFFVVQEKKGKIRQRREKKGRKNKGEEDDGKITTDESQEMALNAKREAEKILAAGATEKNGKEAVSPAGIDSDYETAIFKSAQEELTPVQIIVLHTLRKIDKFSDLGGNNEEERDEAFARVTRELWTEFQTHGRKESDGKKGTRIAPIPDLDGAGSIKILELAGFNTTKKESVKYKRHDEYREDGVTLDAAKKYGFSTPDGGKSIIVDHHDDKDASLENESYTARSARIVEKLIKDGLLDEGETLRDTSATKFAYRGFVKAGLIKEDETLERFVALVTEDDNAKYTDKELKELFNGKTKKFSRTLIGLSRYMTPDQILEVLKEHPDYKKPLPKKVWEKIKGRDPLNGEEKLLSDFSGAVGNRIYGAERAVEDLSKKGFAFDSGSENFGKILIDTGKMKPVGDGGEEGYATSVPFEFLPVRAAGYGAYVIYIPGQKRFKVFTDKSLGDIEFDELGLNIRGCFWNSPDNGGKFTVKLEDILSKLCGKEVQIEGALAKALEAEESNRRKESDKIARNRELMKFFKEKLDLLKHINKKDYGEDIYIRAERLKEKIKNLIAAEIGSKGKYAQWDQKEKAFRELNEEIYVFMVEVEKIEGSWHFSNNEEIYIKEVYAPFAEEMIKALIEENEKNGMGDDAALETMMDDFWVEFEKEISLGGKIAEERIALAVKEIKKNLEK